MIPLRDNNPTERFPIITIILIVLNAAVFIYQVSLGHGIDRFIYNYGAIPYLIAGKGPSPEWIGFPPKLTLFTSMFLHGGWMHLIGNMLYLWIFGNNIEDKLGHVAFIIFYILSGILAALAHIISNPGSQVPTVGASGAIAGVLGAYMIRFPTAKVLVLFWFGFFIRMIYVPAVIVLGFWFILQLAVGLPSLSASQAGGVAYFAHIGGFVAGIILFLILSPLTRRRIIN
jgi:membrane associated rhomboid family serine protease